MRASEAAHEDSNLRVSMGAHHVRRLAVVPGVRLAFVGVAMSWSVDPELSQRRLATLVRLLESEARTASQSNKANELTPKEMLEWAHQCRNLIGTATRPARKAAKPLEEMSDEELLS
jgi:hypothetical protein